MRNIEYRVENKYIVSDLDIAILSSRLKALMEVDIHQVGDCYEIRSIYFDDIWDTCLDENAAGIDCRKKYRVRIYDPAQSVLNLEIKEKQNGLTRKTACPLSQEEYGMICRNEQNLCFGDRKPLNQLILQQKCAEMRPRLIVAYERTAFVHPTGNVRITFDRNIMASRVCEDFQEEQISGLTPVLPVGMHILEVKYDEFLPDMIKRQLELGRLQQTAFSKYYLGRLAVNGEFAVNL